MRAARRLTGRFDVRKLVETFVAPGREESSMHAPQQRVDREETAAPVQSLHAWFEAAMRSTDPDAGLSPSLADKEAMAEVLNLARTSEQGVCAPASPLSTFIVGVAVGRHRGGIDELRRLIDRITLTTNGWRGERLAAEQAFGG
jgi:hypothetical protein